MAMNSWVALNFTPREDKSKSSQSEELHYQSKNGVKVAMKQEGWYNSNNSSWSLEPNLMNRVSYLVTHGVKPLKAIRFLDDNHDFSTLP